MDPRVRLVRWSLAPDRLAQALALVRGELALALLDPPLRAELTALHYSTARQYALGSVYNDSGLFEFERRSLERFFPPPPSSIFVPGCGSGRELLALSATGHRLAGAYDPVTPLVDAARAYLSRNGAPPPLWTSSHEEFSAAVHGASAGRSGTPLDPVRDADGVVVGWGSYTHLLGTSQRVSFLRALRAVCPRAPVLLSFFTRKDDRGSSRLESVRRRLRRAFSLVPGLHPAEPGDRVFGSVVVHFFREQEIEIEAAAAGYRVAHYSEQGYAHAVLEPDSRVA